MRQNFPDKNTDSIIVFLLMPVETKKHKCTTKCKCSTGHGNGRGRTANDAPTVEPSVQYRTDSTPHKSHRPSRGAELNCTDWIVKTRPSRAARCLGSPATALRRWNTVTRRVSKLAASTRLASDQTRWIQVSISQQIGFNLDGICRSHVFRFIRQMQFTPSFCRSIYRSTVPREL